MATIVENVSCSRGNATPYCALGMGTASTRRLDARKMAVLTFPWRQLGNGLKTFVGLPKKSATISFLLNILLREWQIPHRARYDGGLSG